MKQEIFAEILKYWNTFDTKEKIAHLQMYENINAKLHNRFEREVVFVEPKQNKGNLISLGKYNRDDPAILRIAKVKMDKYDAIRVLNTTYHEGYHAFIHDFLDNISDLKTFSNLTKNEFFTEFKQTMLMLFAMVRRSSKDIVSQYFKDYNYEEQLVYKESLIFMVYNILKLSSNKCEIEILYSNFKILISQYFEHEKRIAKPPILITQKDLGQAKQLLNEADELLKSYPNLNLNLSEKKNKRLIKRFKTEKIPEVSAIKYDIIIQLIEDALKNLKCYKGDEFLKFEFEKSAELINLN